MRPSIVSSPHLTSHSVWNRADVSLPPRLGVLPPLCTTAEGEGEAGAASREPMAGG